LRHIEGHQVTVHCTVTRHMARQDGDLDAFVRFWSDVAAVRKIWFSLYTPQMGELSAERLTADDRTRVIAALGQLVPRFRKLSMGPAVIAAMASPPSSPEECIFAKVTRCVSADLERTVSPCQFGGRPVCTECGCYASAGITALGRHRLPGGIAVGTLFDWSLRLGAQTQRLRQAVRGRLPEKARVPPRNAPQAGGV